MEDDVIYHYKNNRKQQSKTFIRMGVVCWIYLAGLYGYEHFFNEIVSDQFRSTLIGTFSTSSVIMFYVAWWHISHPATYQATITKDRFIVDYPAVADWSFDIKVADIKRFENRNTHSHAGEGIMQHGVLLKDGSFHHISMNYGNNINKMHKIIKSINPDIHFPKKVNVKAFGLFPKDYDA